MEKNKSKVALAIPELHLSILQAFFSAYFQKIFRPVSLQTCSQDMEEKTEKVPRHTSYFI